MSKSRVIDLQEILKQLEERLADLRRERLFSRSDGHIPQTFRIFIINSEIKAIKEQISIIKREIFFQNHPNLYKYRVQIEELPLLIAYFLAEVIIIWVYIVVLATNPSLEIIYRLLCIICAPIFLFFAARQYHNFRKKLTLWSKHQVEFDYPKLFLEIENSVSLLNSEGENG